MHTPTAFILRCATSPRRYHLSRFPSYPLAPSFPPLNDSFSYTLKTHLSLARFHRRSFPFFPSFLLFFLFFFFTLFYMHLHIAATAQTSLRYCHLLQWLMIKLLVQVVWHQMAQNYLILFFSTFAFRENILEEKNNVPLVT